MTVELETDGRVVALRRYAEARHAYEAMASETKELKRLYDDAQQTLIEVLQASDAKDTGKIPGVGAATLLAPALKCQVLDGDEEKLADWVKLNGFGDAIYPTLLPSALIDIVQKCQEKGIEIPSFIKTFYVPRLQFRRES